MKDIIVLENVIKCCHKIGLSFGLSMVPHTYHTPRQKIFKVLRSNIWLVPTGLDYEMIQKNRSQFTA